MKIQFSSVLHGLTLWSYFNSKLFFNFPHNEHRITFEQDKTFGNVRYNQTSREIKRGS